MLGLLDQQQIQQFISEGYVRLENAFSSQLAAAARDILWNDIPFDRHNPASWTQPVVRLGMYTQPPFVDAANSPQLIRIYNQLAGEGQWLPCKAMGSFPVRFPSDTDAGDTGLHVDAGFPGDDPMDYFGWRINVTSKGRALLMLFLFSDISENDAPTRLLKGSHLEVARLLQPAGDRGLSFMELAGELPKLPVLPEVLATGKAGTVYLCHPFMVHAAQRHQGSEPRFMAQPPLRHVSEFDLDAEPLSPVAQATKQALSW